MNTVLNIVQIRDIVADAYMTPQFTNSLGGAVRGFQDACNDPNHELGKHPEHYELWHVADWEADTGKIIPNAAPRQLIAGAATKRA